MLSETLDNSNFDITSRAKNLTTTVTPSSFIYPALSREQDFKWPLKNKSPSKERLVQNHLNLSWRNNIEGGSRTDHMNSPINSLTPVVYGRLPAIKQVNAINTQKHRNFLKQTYLNSMQDTLKQPGHKKAKSFALDSPTRKKTIAQ